MPRVLKRRADVQASPSPPPPTRRRRSPSSSSAVSDLSATNDAENHTQNSEEQIVKKFVRLALASEFTRTPIRRAEVGVKVLGPTHARSFKHTFARTQSVLAETFGLTLTELPLKERVTVAQKRAAQRSGQAETQNTAAGAAAAANAGSKAWIVTSTLPASFRNGRKRRNGDRGGNDENVLRPVKAGPKDAEAGYVGFYSFVVAVIMLSQGQRCTEGKLERVLKRCNAEEYVLGGEKVEKVLKRMERDGYVVKVREREAGGEENVEWVVGPRGKVEVGEEGVAGVVRGVFGAAAASAEDDEDRDPEQGAQRRNGEMIGVELRLERSLGKGTFRSLENGEDGNADVENGDGEEAAAEEEEAEERSTERRRCGRNAPVGRRRIRNEEEEEEDEEEGEEENDDDENENEEDDEEEGEDEEDE
ncbi:hypothetical protein MMC25_000729 [Agyrium rufum]|nr:hypothetical protein [Agyrium rufum]